jgi:hypothetical protein
MKITSRNDSRSSRLRQAISLSSELVSTEEVTWWDCYLGYPQPEMQYTQALVNSTLIILSVDDKQYRNHSGKGGTHFQCEHQPQSPLPSSDP